MLLNWRFREDLHLEPLPSHGSVQDSYTSEAKVDVRPGLAPGKVDLRTTGSALRLAHEINGSLSRFCPGTVSFTTRNAAVTP